MASPIEVREVLVSPARTGKLAMVLNDNSERNIRMTQHRLGTTHLQQLMLVRHDGCAVPALTLVTNTYAPA